MLPTILEPLLIKQIESHDCGVACLAMATQCGYATAREAFNRAGLDIVRKGRRPYSSNFKELTRAFAEIGHTVALKRFPGWAGISGPTVVKLKYGKGKNWHWVFASRTETLGLHVLDPATGVAYLEFMVEGEVCMPLSYFPATGCILELIPS
jgi:ABC-type bacteriocin/lantibiotic exporter with double-glycine peptidase domain